MKLRLPLPNELDALLGGDDQRPQDGDNVGLWLDKYLRVRDRAPKGGRAWMWSLEKEERVEELRRRVCRESVGAARTQCSPAAAAAVERMREAAVALYGEHHRRVVARVHGRLLVDYGRASAHELSVSAHHVFGCPRIPGSALKGLTRSWLTEVEPAKLDADDLFGHGPESTSDGPRPDTRRGARRGRLVFHDALPVEGKFKLAVDVLTPHYGAYYQGKAPPAEWLSPIPHTFVTVVETTFEWVIGLLPSRGEVEEKSVAEALDTVVRGLADALEDEGIGAKRAAGYGRMKMGGMEVEKTR